MTLTLRPLLLDAGIDPTEALVIRHAFEDAPGGLHADSTDDEILAYTARQYSDPRRFPATAPRYWVVFIREGGTRARLWSVLENRGMTDDDGTLRTFDVTRSPQMEDLRDRLVVGWRAPRSWWMWATTASAYPVLEIADAKPVPFPGFDRLLIGYATLQAVMREHRYAAWRTALASVKGIYLITDTEDGRHYVGKADGAETISQRWAQYALDGHGGDVKLKPREPRNFQFSLLRVFDPSTPQSVIDAAEMHYKNALDSVRHGLNGA